MTSVLFAPPHVNRAARSAGCSGYRCRGGGGWSSVDVEANAFLHHMVRNIVGSLIEVGGGARPPGWIAALLAGRDRSKAAPTAAPDGLYLLGVHYPDRFDLPRFPVNDPLFLLS